MMKHRLRLSLAKNLFNFKKSPMARAVYNSEYARFASRQSLEQVYSALYAHRRGLSEHDVEYNCFITAEMDA